MKRILALLLVLTLAAGLCACAPAETADDGLQVAATIFPVYDWARAVLGGNPAGAELTMLLSNGVDLHSYQPSARDIWRLSTCDLFLYVGGESDEWVEDALAEAANPDLVAVNLMDVLGDALREEETVEGMQGTAEEKEETLEYDEHIWLSLKNAAVLTDAIAQALAFVDPEHADAYAANAEAYISELDALDHFFQDAAESGAQHTILFGDRFPFRYFTEDYGLDYYAAFAGCSAETEASFETIVFLAGQVDRLDLPAVLTLEGSDGRIAQTIVATTEKKDQAILAMNSMQSVTAKDAAAGVTYLDLMRDNLDILRRALG